MKPSQHSLFVYLASKIDAHRSVRWAFALLLTTYAILFLGYYFGTYDQASHIPYLLKSINPSLYPNDYFMEIRHQHYSFFWYFFKPFYQWNMLEGAMFVAHVFSTWLTFVMIWRISKQIYRDSLISALICLSFVSMHIGFAGFRLLEFSFLNRTFVLPYLLLAMSWWLDKHWYRSMLLLGFMYNLHALSVHFVLAMFGVDLILTMVRERHYFRSFGRMALCAALFLLPALPIFIWKFGNSSIEIGLSWEWFHIVSNGILAVIFFPLDITKTYSMLFSLSGISALAIYFYTAKSLKHRIFGAQSLNHFMIAIVLVLGIAIASSYVYPATVIVQAQIIRIGVFGMFIGLMHGVAYLVQRYRSKKMSHQSVVVCAVMLFTAPLTFLPIIFYSLIRTFAKPRLWLAVYAILCVSFYTSAYRMGVWQPGIFIREQESAFTKAQYWARDNTPVDTVFITPPSEWFFYNHEWRVVSQRSTVVTLADLLEVAFAPSATNTWKERFEDVAPAALGHFRGDYLENRTIANNAYNSHTTKSIMRVAQKYGAQYIVMQRDKVLQLPIAYENEQYRIYQVFSSR